MCTHKQQSTSEHPCQQNTNTLLAPWSSDNPYTARSECSLSIQPPVPHSGYPHPQTVNSSPLAVQQQTHSPMDVPTGLYKNVRSMLAEPHTTRPSLQNLCAANNRMCYTHASCSTAMPLQCPQGDTKAIALSSVRPGLGRVPPQRGL